MKRYHFVEQWKGDFDLSEVQVYIICGPSDAADAVSYIKGQSVLYVDCEGHNFGNRDEETLSLVQIATGPKHCFIFDIVECPDSIALLKDTLESKTTTKVFHDCSGDSAVLSSRGITLQGVYDTQVAQLLIDRENKWGIRKNYLSNLYTGRDMEHRSMEVVPQAMMPPTKWFKRPLKEEDIAYAVVDVLFLIEVFRKQKPLIPSWPEFLLGVDTKLKQKLTSQSSYSDSDNVWTKYWGMSSTPLRQGSSAPTQSSYFNTGTALPVGAFAIFEIAGLSGTAGSSKSDAGSTKAEDKEEKTDRK